MLSLSIFLNCNSGPKLKLG